MPFYRVLLTSLSILFFAATTAQARVIINERTTFYNVSGKSGKALFQSIGKRGPKVRARHAIATTTSAIRVRNLKPKITRRACRVGSVDVIVDITYRYPRWKGARKASPKLQKAWKNFMKKVRVHERIHGRIAKDHARDVHKTLKGFRGRVSRGCKNFGRGAERKFRRQAKKADRRHRMLDRRDSRVWSRNARLQRALYKAR